MDDHSRELVKGILIFLFGLLGLSLIATTLSYSGIIQYLFASLGENYMDAIFQFAVYAITFAIFIPLLGLTTLKEFLISFKLPKNIRDGIALGIIVICSQILYGAISKAIFGDTTANDNEQQIREITLVAPVLMFFTIVIIGPIVEEFTYRYGLFRTLNKVNRPLAYIGSAIVFGLIHFTYSDNPAELTNELIQLPSYILSGVILCYAYDRNKSLSTSIVAHVTNNLFAFISTIIATVSA